jgi:flagellar biosynthesis protein FlhG
MALTLSVGSGKGGTGKSVVLTNLALLLAKSGKKVCVVDLDIGGANDHIFFGLFQPEKTLSDFFSRQVSDLNEVIHTFDSFYGLQLIPGTGDTLQTANMTFQEKMRLLRALKTIDADIVLIDVGAGTSYHTLDFFMAADLHICTTMPEHTSIMDFYTFVKLATVRKALDGFLSHSEVSSTLKKKNFQTITEVFDLAEEVQQGAKIKIQKDLESFHPMLVVNQVVPGSKLNTLKLKKLVSKYLGIYLPELGEIPVDDEVGEALQAYMPVCEYAPGAPASIALNEIHSKLIKVINLFNK